MRTLKDGQLISEGMTSLVDVKIRDLSASGARVETKSVIKLPAAFTLFVLSQKHALSLSGSLEKRNTNRHRIYWPPTTRCPAEIIAPVPAG